jgi:hypothetical protein
MIKNIKSDLVHLVNAIVVFICLYCTISLFGHLQLQTVHSHAINFLESGGSINTETLNQYKSDKFLVSVITLLVSAIFSISAYWMSFLKELKK